MKELVEIFEIELERLDEHWQQQPQLMAYWGDEAAKAKVQLERVKSDLQTAIAELKLAYRVNPPAGVKVTEAALDDLVNADEKIQRLKELVIQATEDYERKRAVVWALENRKTALENLVQLFGSEYFAMPRAKLYADIKKEKIRKILKEGGAKK